MDFDIRASTIHSSKHLSAVQASRLHRENCLVFYDSDGDDDSPSYFICPFCYGEIEVPVLCSHLQDEHCFDLKNAVCPLCAANLGKDAIGHFVSQHPSSLKRRRKPEKSDSWSADSTVLGKKQATYGRGNKHEPTTDPLLSPFLYNLYIPVPNGIHLDEHSSNNATVISDPKSSDAQEMGDEQDHQERRLRAAFVQQLVASTIF